MPHAPLEEPTALLELLAGFQGRFVERNVKGEIRGEKKNGKGG